MTGETLCAACGRDYSADATKTAPGYGVWGDTGERLCYDCCAEREWAYMADHGRGLLYDSGTEVTDWAGRLRFRVRCRREGEHNLAGQRYDLWFTDRDGAWWHGVRYGDMTQIAHCRRLKHVPTWA